ncbi:MAG: SDR family oxidoreductase [Candidatus Aminicenantes bacterium]|jgi:acyl transferase domain-containing protein/acyl carrier protein
MSEIKNHDDFTGLEVAVIGMAGRFPGARNIYEFWENIKKGVECLRFFSDEELEDAGVPREVYKNPDYVNTCGGVLEDFEYFDAAFFDYTPSEAEMLDPQVRLFHECSWEALEDAGYYPASYKGLIGVFAGAEDNTDWKAKLLFSGADSGTYFTKIFMSNKDFVSARVSYKLNLNGPVYSLATGCSTALVAIHLACRSLVGGECDMALAGGVYLRMPTEEGYMYTEGMLASADGHVHAFDANASGTVFGSGVGAVLLKPLENALEDNDHIYALIKGSAVNNDGNRKVNFAAPSIKGQTQVIREALKVAGIDPASIGYIETHGTGTSLGDPIEMNALTQAYNPYMKNKCPIGSVKTNIGHLDVAAGVVGLIKTVLMLKHKKIPPSLNFNVPNPEIDFENSPFYVNTQLQEWQNNSRPLRSGLSSFGFGGTNVHAILEEAPKRELAAGGREYQIITLSTKTPTSLEAATEKLGAFLREHPDTNLADAAYTLQVGRQAFPYRRMFVCKNIDEAIHTLLAPGDTALLDGEEMHTQLSTGEERPVVFMCSGQGSQYVNMGLELYQKEPTFREDMDRGFDIYKSITGNDVKEVLFPSTDVEKARAQINAIENSGPIKFIFEYSIGKLLMRWGIKPSALVGHSFGEYTAACLAGVFSLTDALKLVHLRGELMLSTPPGGMMSVALSEEELTPLLDDDISLAAVNSSSLCFVSGPPGALDNLENQLEKKGHQCIRINFPRAAHSTMMEPITGKLAAGVKQVKLQQPTVPYMSSLIGDWASPEDIAIPDYWVRHLVKPVQFSTVIGKLLKNSNCIFVQLSSDKGLTIFFNQHRDFTPETLVVSMIRHVKEDISDMYHLFHQLGLLWLHGATLDWSAFYAGERRYRISLPTYAFDKHRYWIEGEPFAMASQLFSQPEPVKRKNVSQWLYTSSWQRCPWVSSVPAKVTGGAAALVFLDNTGLGIQLVKQLEEKGHDVIVVKAGKGFLAKDSREYHINPAAGDDYDALFADLRKRKKIPALLIHLWTVTGHQGTDLTLPVLEQIQDLGFYSLLHMVQSMGRLDITGEIRMKVITNNMLLVLDEEGLCPEKSLLIGAVKVIPLEYPNINCQALDVVLPKPGSEKEGQLIRQLAAAFDKEFPSTVIACRGNHFWKQVFEPVPLENSREIAALLKLGGVYLITGGFGGVGYVLAEFLAQQLKAKLVLTGRSELPPKSRWSQWLDTHDDDDPVAQKIQKVMTLEQLGSEVLAVKANVANEEQMRQVVLQIKKRFGTINGIIHTAGLVDYAGVIQRRTREMTEEVLAPKVRGTVILDLVTRDSQLDFFFICSSMASIVPSFGEVGYIAANVFLDNFAHYKTLKDGVFTVSVDWDTWQQVGAAVEAFKKKHGEGERLQALLKDAILPQEGIQAFNLILENPIPQVVVSTKDLELYLEQIERVRVQKTGDIEPAEQEEKAPIPEQLRPRPKLSSSYVAPRNEVEKNLANIWANYFSLQKVGIQDDFFELGGDSLMATVIAAKMHKRLNVKIPLMKLFQGPTIEALAVYIESQTEKTFTSIEPVEKKEFYPVSSAQKRVYVLQHADKSGTDFNVPIVVVLSGDLDKNKLVYAFKKLLDRHESLRTSFLMIYGVTVQKVHDYENLPFSITCHEASEDQVKGVVKGFIRPFDLAKALLLRVGVIQLEGEKQILMADIHHIISDAVSLALFVGEFIQLYQGNTLPPLRLQYRDYSQWQNRKEQVEALERQEAYWLKEFKDQPPVLNLLYDFERPAEQTIEGSIAAFKIPKEHTDGLNHLTSQEEVTLFMMLVAILNVLLYKLSGQEDIVIGTAVLNRRHEDLMPIIGVFANTLVLRNFPYGEKTFKEFLSGLKVRTLEAFENQDYQFGDLVEELKIKKDPSRNSLFDVMFQWQNVEFPEASLPGLTISPYSAGETETTAQLDMHFIAIERGEEIYITLTYKTRLFKPETIQRYIEHFKMIVASVIENPEQTLAEIEIIPGDKKESMVTELGGNLEDE